MKSIIVKKAHKMDLINYLLNTFPSLNQGSIYKALRNKDIRINDFKITKNTFLKENDKIDIYITDDILYGLPKKLDVIYEDENILVVYKPQGILTNNKDKKVTEPTLEDLVKENYKNAILCHRLDRNTSGLVIFAKNKESYKEILNGFKNNCIKKEYIAYVCGSNFSRKHDILEKYILKDKNKGYCKIYDKKVENSKKIITEYEVLNINKIYDYSILKITIHNGKTHQIRAQLKAINHPIIGDQKYGINEINKNFKIYKQLLFAIHYSFIFNENSYLYYLNCKNIHLNEKYFNNKLGSDINEENRKNQ